MWHNDDPTFVGARHFESTTMFAPTPLRRCVHTAVVMDTLNVNAEPSVEKILNHNHTNNNTADVQERIFNNYIYLSLETTVWRIYSYLHPHYIVAIASLLAKNTTQWLLDSGATHHMTPRK